MRTLIGYSALSCWSIASISAESNFSAASRRDLPVRVATASATVSTATGLGSPRCNTCQTSSSHAVCSRLGHQLRCAVQTSGKNAPSRALRKQGTAAAHCDQPQTQAARQLNLGGVLSSTVQQPNLRAFPQLSLLVRFLCGLLARRHICGILLHPLHALITSVLLAQVGHNHLVGVCAAAAGPRAPSAAHFGGAPHVPAPRACCPSPASCPGRSGPARRGWGSAVAWRPRLQERLHTSPGNRHLSAAHGMLPPWAGLGHVAFAEALNQTCSPLNTLKGRERAACCSHLVIGK